MNVIGKIIATEKQPSTIEDFTFWTKSDLKLKTIRCRSGRTYPKLKNFWCR